jgi:hypothetical protein
VTAPGYANVEVLAATLRGWASSAQGPAGAPGLDLGGLAADLRNAAEWVLRTVENDRAGLTVAITDMSARQDEAWFDPKGPVAYGYRHAIASVVELIRTGIPPVIRR